MDNTERLIQKRTLHSEGTFAVEFSDLPALSDPFGRRPSRLAQRILDWQRCVHRRRISVCFTFLLALLAVFVILSSLHASLTAFANHDDLVSTVRWSPNSSYIASASFDMTVQVWDAKSGKLLLAYMGHRDVVYSLAWSPVARASSLQVEMGLSKYGMGSSGRGPSRF